VAALVGSTDGLGLPPGLGAIVPVVVPSGSAGPGNGASPAAAAAVSWALARLGTPYRWGGEGDGGFDCSGLVQAAYAAAGVPLPRVAQDQYDKGPQLPSRAPLQPGDLVFFGTSPTGVDHVGIVVAPGEMVDAPHTGAVVRVEPIWSDGFVGATRPAS
jgi:cell wall-associated NlpC family hydrolase